MSGLVTLHVGTPKSGTTSLQQAFRESRAALAREGIAYVAPAGDLNASGAVADAARADPAYWARATPEQRRYLGWSWRSTSAGAQVRLLRAAMPDADTAVIISAENLSQAGVVLRDEVLRWCADRPVRVVVTRRRPSAALISTYYQVLRLGPVRPLGVWLRGMLVELLDRRGDSIVWWLPPGPLEEFWAGGPADRLEVVTVDLPGVDPSAEMQRAADAIVGSPGIVTDIPRLNARRSDALLAALQMVAREDPRLDRMALHALMGWATPHVRAKPAAGGAASAASPPPALSPALADLIDEALGWGADGAEAAGQLRELLATGTWPEGFEVHDPIAAADTGEVAELAALMRRRRGLARAAASGTRARSRAAGLLRRG